MKFKTKLLPIAGLATACVAVTFPLTSCGKNQKEEPFVNLLERYVPTIKQLDIDVWTKQQALDRYIEDATTNPEIIRQDIYWYASNSVLELAQALNYKVRITDMSCKNHKVGEQNFTLFNYTFEYELSTTWEEGDAQVYETYKGKSIYKNLPFYIGTTVIDGKDFWHFTYDYDLIVDSVFSSVVDWSIEVSFDKTDTYELTKSIVGEYTYTTHTSDTRKYVALQSATGTLKDIDKQRIQAALSEDGSFYSWHLHNIVPRD